MTNYSNYSFTGSSINMINVKLLLDKINSDTQTDDEFVVLLVARQMIKL